MPHRTLARRRDNDLSARNGLRFHGLWVSLLLVSLGLQFRRPQNTFLSAEIYREMAKVATEDTWGAIMLVLGTCRILAILYALANGDQLRSALSSAVLSGFSSALWFKIGLLFYAVNPYGWSCLAAMTFFLHDATTCIYTARIAGTTSRRIVVNGPRNLS